LIKYLELEMLRVGA